MNMVTKKAFALSFSKTLAFAVILGGVIASSGCVNHTISYVNPPTESIADTVKVTLIRFPAWMQSTMAYPVFDTGDVYDGNKLAHPGDGWYQAQAPARKPFRTQLAKNFLAGNTQVGEIGSEGTLSWVRKPGKFQIKLLAFANPRSLFFVSDEFVLQAGKEYVFGFYPSHLNNGRWRVDSKIWRSVDLFSPSGASRRDMAYTTSNSGVTTSDLQSEIVTSGDGKSIKSITYSVEGIPVSQREFEVLMASDPYFVFLRQETSPSGSHSSYLSVLVDGKEFKVFVSKDSPFDLPFVIKLE